MKNNYVNDYYNILKNCSKPSRYIGGEINQICKSEYDIHFCLAFPDTYEIGMSHLGLRILYHYLNREKDIFTERVFAPWPDMADLLKERGVPLLSLESKTPLNRFDMVGFSFQYELEYTNVLNMLDLGGIPLFSRERNEEHPFIMAGGPVAVNPEPMAPFIDLFVIGDGENITIPLLRLLINGRKQALSRGEILHQAAQLQGVYVPSLYPTKQDKESRKMMVQPVSHLPFPISKNLLMDINEYPFPDRIIVPHHEIIHDRISIEIARGCTQGCRFCQAGFIYRPGRERSIESINTSIQQSITNTGYKDVSLTSLSPADFTGISPLVSQLMSDLRARHVTLHLSSLRVYGLSKEIAAELGKGRKTGFTIAPEAGSQRLRNVINKNISEEDILTGARNAFEQGWELIKLYTMIGLPTETPEDVNAIAELAIKILKMGREILGKKARINLAVSTFIPKPFTPFQWVPFLSRQELEEKQEIIKKKLIPFKSIKFSFTSYDISLLEALFSRGDRQLSEVICHAWQNGARFDAWRDFFDFSIWENSLFEKQIDTSVYLKEIPLDENLPWDHLDWMVDKKFLKNEYTKSLKAQGTPPCEQPLLKTADEKPDKIRRGDNYVCYQCGLGCDLPAISDYHRSQLAELEEAQPKSAIVQKEEPVDNIQYRYLIHFSKKRPLHLLSHLSTIQLLARLFHRSDLDVKYSTGFHPRPVISIARALGLGIESDDEWMMITLNREEDPLKMIHVLNDNAPQGLLFKKIVSISEKIVWDNYFLHQIYHIEIPPALISFSQIENKCRKYQKSSSQTITRISKKGEKQVDLKKFIEILEFSGDKFYTSLKLELLALPSGSARVDDFIQHVLGVPSNECTILKINSYPTIDL